MNPVAASCALCDQTIDGGATAHAVSGKFICEACRRIVLASEPRHVLPYADQGPTRRRRRWLLPATAAIVVVALLLSLLLIARNIAVQRARAEQLRAMIAEQNARAAAVQARLAATQPGQ